MSKILTRSSERLDSIRPRLRTTTALASPSLSRTCTCHCLNPNKYHPNGCDPYVADVNMLLEIRSRMKLVICDATTAMYEGGPGFKPEHSWKCNGLLVSQDPVALDSTGWQMIERKRAEMDEFLEAEQRAPRYIATAADSEHRLGHCDPSRVVVVEA